MSRKVLIVEPPRTPAIARYRIGHAAKWLLPDDDVTVLNVLDLSRELRPDEQEHMMARAAKVGVTVHELLLAFWANNHEGFDIVWCAIWEEALTTLVQHYKNLGATIIGDVDDWYRGVPSYNPAFRAWKNPRSHTVMDEHLDILDGLTVATPFLQEKLGGSLCQNFIDPTEWGTEVDVDRQPGGRWNDYIVVAIPAGTGRAGDYLDIEKPLRDALKLPNVKLLTMAWMPAWALSYPVGKVVYTDAVEFNFYMHALPWLRPDIVISPMKHNDFNKAKSNLKWLEAAMSGAAFMGERWGELERTIDDMETGVLAGDIDEWSEKLVWLCEDHDNRKKIARQGKEVTMSDWTWEKSKDAWQGGVFDEPRKASHHSRASSLVA